MRNGDGSIAEVLKPNGRSYNPKRWRITISYTVEQTDELGNALLDEKGKPVKKCVRVQKRTEGTKAEARELRDQLIAERDDNGRLYSEIEAEQKAIEEAKVEMTLNRMIPLWDGARRTAGKASERVLKEGVRWLGHVTRHIGDVPLKDITPQMVEATYAAIREERGLSGTSMNHIHLLLKSVLQKAIDYDCIYKNPCAHVVAPRRDDPKRSALSIEEGARLMAEVDGSEAEAYAKMDEKEARRAYREEHGTAKERKAFRGLHHIGNITAVRLGLATGMRRGEVFAVTWENVDLDRRTIRVCQSITYQRKVKTPKTQAGIRTLAIDATTASHLAMWKERQATELAKIGVKQTEKTPVCCSDTGGWYRIDNFEHWWDVWRKEHGFEGLKFHELRHTQATQLLANGVDVKTVQTRLGHANASITLGWYAHAIPEKDHDAADLLGNLLASNAPTSENAVEAPAEGVETEDEKMSPLCLQQEQSEAQRKQASRLKKAS